MGGVDVLRWIGPVVFFSSVSVLVAVDGVSWRRSAPLRIGRGPPDYSPSGTEGSSRTSPVTVLPGWAGVAAMAWGGFGPAPNAAQFVIVAGGLLVALSGFVGRVVSVEVTPGGLMIRYVARRACEISWQEVRMLRAPRWPLGGWCVIGESERRTLMPSDLLGQEWTLGAVIDRAGLRFVEGAWARARPEIPVSRAG